MSKRVIILLAMCGMISPNGLFEESEGPRLSAPRQLQGPKELTEEEKKQIIDECVFEATGVAPGASSEEGPYAELVEQTRLKLHEQFDRK